MHLFYWSFIRVLLALCIFTLKSSTEILGENNARRLLKSIQNHEILINNVSINMPDYFIITLYRKKFIFQIEAAKLNANYLVLKICRL